MFTHLTKVELALEQNKILKAQTQALMEYLGVKVKNLGNGVFEVVKDIPPVGDYTDPIQYMGGDEIICGLWYYLDDKDLPHEAIKNGFPTDFNDKEYFSYIEM